MKKIHSGLVAMLSLSSGIGYADVTISNYAGGYPIVIKSCDDRAGAVCSLTWRGKEFIDNYDHGRQLQSAVVFSSSGGSMGESCNPTEAGSFANGTMSGNGAASTSSVLQGRGTPAGNILTTQTDMAYWLTPPNPSCYNSGLNASHHILNKQVTIGVTIGSQSMAHVIQYLSSFTLPTGASYPWGGTYEAVTGYMPAEFRYCFTYHKESQSLAQDCAVNGEQGRPVVFSTGTNLSDNSNFAMGIFSPDSPQAGWGNYGYGSFPTQFTPQGVVKWNNVFRYGPAPAAVGFRSYVAVGSLENVRVSLAQLHMAFNK